MACRSSWNTALASLLLQRGAPARIADVQNGVGRTALMEAVEAENAQVRDGAVTRV